MSQVRDVEHLVELTGIPYSPAQVEAITADLDRPGAIIAGAGSGKTTVMAARVLWLVGHLGIAPERILGLTFTTKAAAELGQRIRAGLELLPTDPDRPWGETTASTYHAFAGSLIAEHGLRLGIEPDLRVVTDASRFQRVARVVESYDGALEHVGTHVPTLVGQVVALDGQLSEHLVTPEQLREEDAAVIAEFAALGKPALLRDAAATAARRTELSLLVERYRESKESDGVMDFSDQMAGGARLAALPEVRAAMRERYDVVMLDEYQDTSVAQRDLLVQLFGGLPVTAVGDPAQGIYGWRGAATGNLEDFLDDFTAPDGTRGRGFSLVQTRRCAPTVIDVANHVAAPFYATSSVVRPLESARTDATGRVDVSLHRTVDEEISALVGEIVAEHERGRSWSDMAVLVRIARENGEIVKALRDAHVPFQIVGLSGLLAQPEVVDVLSLLEVVEDLAANPAVLRLLTGPRWNVGPRDLALLGRRAARLSGRGAPEDAPSLADELARAVEGTDPTEVLSLAEALDDPGSVDDGYDPEALERFADLSRVIHAVRRHAGEPLLELARRAVRMLDLDIELEAGEVEGASDNLATFLDAVADYAGSDRYASLGGLIAYLRAEQDFNEGMEVTTPAESDAVSLLTIHRAKGLEWPCVFVPFVSETVFPSTRGRASWLGNASALPSALRGDAGSLPVLAEWSPAAGKEYRAACREQDQLEEVRLAYVAYTRAEERVVVSGHWWGRTQLKPRGPSSFLLRTREWLADRGVEALHWADPPPPDETNPHLVDLQGIAWPAPAPRLTGRELLAEEVRRARTGAGRGRPPTAELPVPGDRVAEISQEIDLLLAEEDRRSGGTRTVELPATLSTTQVVDLSADEATFARSQARPMPRRPSGAARFGTRFHAWVEDHYGQRPLLDPTDLPGQGDVDLADDAELEEVIAMFEAGPYGAAVPHAIEAPFSLLLAGRQVVGRIDAVFSTGTPDDPRFEVVDWKTGRRADADPLQLSIYRLAWAELNDLDPARVSAAFSYVRLGEVRRFAPEELLDRPALEALVLLSGGPPTVG